MLPLRERDRRSSLSAQAARRCPFEPANTGTTWARCADHLPAGGVKRDPLSIVSPKPHAFLNSQYGNAADEQRAQGEQPIFLHPEDAAERGVSPGDLVQTITGY
ncbi:MAG: molybdopterin dinucleotide binding domain-containing protein [Pseudonocardiaceae bacterium]